MVSGTNNDLGMVGVVVCVQAYYLFVEFAKRRLGLGREFYRLIVPWGAATIAFMSLVAWLISRGTLPKGCILVPALLTGTLALVEWARWRSARRLGVLPPEQRRSP